MPKYSESWDFIDVEGLLFQRASDEFCDSEVPF